ncbi:hypothetical protein LKMONMHP_3832 [Methylobacterium organophilum]|uniref:Uncharacterized protein n=1 Tax=Methylobacterium organophilum TaxID=410 RepID=A0ABQ4TFZ9_METOR|nr:hypothetical protein LKMONMHP_3832 [Methylobacterium organophilum]
MSPACMSATTRAWPLSYSAQASEKSLYSARSSGELISGS